MTERRGVLKTLIQNHGYGALRSEATTNVNGWRLKPSNKGKWLKYNAKDRVQHKITSIMKKTDKVEAKYIRDVTWLVHQTRSSTCHREHWLTTDRAVNNTLRWLTMDRAVNFNTNSSFFKALMNAVEQLTCTMTPSSEANNSCRRCNERTGNITVIPSSTHKALANPALSKMIVILAKFSVSATAVVEILANLN